MGSLPCLLCGKMLGQRTDKNGKPYFVCDPCGTQYFVRRKLGMERLSKLVSALKGQDSALRVNAMSLLTIQGIIGEIEGVKGELRKVEDKISHLFPDGELIRVRRALRNRLKWLLAQLEES